MEIKVNHNSEGFLLMGDPQDLLVSKIIDPAKEMSRRRIQLDVADLIILSLSLPSELVPKVGVGTACRLARQQGIVAR